ncbi:pyruvate kinase [Ruoffia sp. FAM 24228]|uniref:pyruvate kinase n=1 Tax=unclassified Ruoffia TaxID=2862149 RepID=UPI00388521A1
MTYSSIKEQTQIYDDLTELYQQIKAESETEFKAIDKYIERNEFRESARNLFAYLALRRRDIRSLQADLSSWGLSSLGRLESRTLFTLESVIRRLGNTIGKDMEIEEPESKQSTAGRNRLAQNTQLFFGDAPRERNTRIMVTMPTEASEDKVLLKELIESGMNVARINAAHDNEDTWSAMIDNIHEVAEELDKKVKILIDIAGPKIRTDWVFTKFKKPKVKAGDLVRMTKDYVNLPALDDDIKVTIGCSIPQIFEQLSIDDLILIDDGSIELEVKKIGESEALLLVKRVRGGSVRIKAEKGLNFPKTEFDIDVLTDEDRKAIHFAVEHADMIGCSFIRTTDDIEEIQAEIEKTNRPLNDIPLTLKIETVQAMNNLPEVILKAGSRNPVSVMIARGDLAVESGYVRLAELQQEILWICEASDTPVIWGTEVLASMLDEGIPSRAEMTDAAEGSRSECVMLNKGSYMSDTVQMLNDILIKMEEHQYKKTPTLRSLNVAKIKLP